MSLGVLTVTDEQICAWVVEAMDRCQRQKRRRDVDTIVRFTLNKHSVGAETVRQAIRRMEERGVIVGVPIADYVSYRMTAKSPACGGLPGGGVGGGGGGVSAERRKRPRSGDGGGGAAGAAATPAVKRPLVPVFPKLEPGADGSGNNTAMRLPLMPHPGGATYARVLPATAVMVSKGGPLPLAPMPPQHQQLHHHQLQATITAVPVSMSQAQLLQPAAATAPQAVQVAAMMPVVADSIVPSGGGADPSANAAHTGGSGGSMEAASAESAGGGSGGGGVIVEEPAPSVLDWTVEEVRDWLKCEGYPAEADCFLNEQVDGISLMLIRRMDLLTRVGIRLGPAIKIFAKIRDLQTRVSAMS